ncbi:DUF3800 domain-containing protein [Crystallibacter crystallopoietes]|uniref:DUF3800 domain-containing protein n=1 Tax=Crystallibacter crystallopoietes TaxID=37928 RepID=UPI0012379C3F|nr:DUF3800 domain-containing protein [Arthrobacter crystallopoietes]
MPRVERHIEIVSDESGSEGENLYEASSRVFTHASVNIDTEAAAMMMSDLQRRAHAKSVEFKSKQLLRPTNQDLIRLLLDSNGPLAGHANVHLTDKQYFLTGKMIDLLVEEYVHSKGGNLYRDGSARRMAWTLFREGPRALGNERWELLLSTFNSMTRIKQSNGQKASVQDFYNVVDEVRLTSKRRKVEEILDLVWKSRSQAEDFQRQLEDEEFIIPNLDPVVPGAVQTARTWHERTNRPIQLVHDQQSVFTPTRVQAIISQVNRVDSSLGIRLEALPLVGISQVDSTNDPRVQVADLLAGIGRTVALAALARKPHPSASLLRPFVDSFSIWGDETTWLELTGHRLGE